MLLNLVDFILIPL